MPLRSPSASTKARKDFFSGIVLEGIRKGEVVQMIVSSLVSASVARETT